MSEDNLQESFLSFHYVGPNVIELRSSGLYTDYDVSPLLLQQLWLTIFGYGDVYTILHINPLHSDYQRYSIISTE